MQATRLMVLALLLPGCPDRTISAVIPEQGKVEVKDIPAIPRRKIDILFQIDSSQSMQDEQASLRANFPRFIDVLDSIEGGRPDVHIGVITPDMGTSAIDGTQAATAGTCVGRGEGGALRQLPGQSIRFLADEIDANGNRVPNYPGTLAEAFSSLADVGFAGCGVEQHLEATRAALDNHPSNIGFVRDDAYLAVVLVADEDDCSLAKSTLFDGNRGDGTYGDRVNFRCVQESVECDTPGTPLDQGDGVRSDCHPRFEDTLVTPMDRYVDFMKARKPDKRDVIVAGIVGPQDPFQVKTASGVSKVQSSCPSGNPQVAFPAVRMGYFLDQFDDRNTRASICESNFSTALTQIAAQIKQNFGDPCFANDLADVDPVAEGPQYDCTITEVRHHANGTDEELGVLPRCETGRLPCWRVEEDAAKCFYTDAAPHLKLVIDRGDQVPEADLRIKAACVTRDSSGSPL